ERGVETVLLYDAIGSIGVDGAMFDELRRAGVKVAEFGPIAPWRRRFRFGWLTRRDHRKVLVVDGQVGFTGGINVAKAWLPLEEGGGGWRDDMVRVQGPVVRQLVTGLLAAWRRAGGAHLEPTRPYHSGTPERGGQRAHVVGEGFRKHRHQITRAYLAQLYHAKKTAWITSAYFVPDRSVMRALTRAADRGVDVRVLLPAESDVEIVRHASRATWSRLLRHGVRIYEFEGRILHAKSAVIDGRWSTVGTFNLDYLSLRWLLEVNLCVLDEEFGSTMQRSFLRDLEHSREVDARAHRFRPLGDRLLELILYRFRKLL
ncbi:MAG TPA: phospholipase D-like domain-containing protein, partial [Polyangiaceae bacterium]|nr:phospholipase D-like domain-containing protein [Polyangiaceae bacterium]